MIKKCLLFAPSAVMLLGITVALEAQKAGKPEPEKMTEDSLARLKKAIELSENYKQIQHQVRFLVNEALRDRDVHVRLAALNSLATLGGSAASGLDKLVMYGLRDKSDEVRARTADVLGYIGPTAERAVPPLAKLLLEDKSALVRFRASVALSFIRMRADVAVPALIKALKDPDREQTVPVRNSAALSLGFYQKDARTAIPALLAEMKTDDTEFKGSVIHGLGRIRSDYLLVKPVFVAILKDPTQERLHLAVIHALQFYGADATDVVDLLLGMYPCNDVKDGKRISWTRDSIIRTVGRIGAKNKNVVPTLLSILRQNDTPLPLRRTCYLALAELGPAAKDAIPFLIAVLNINKGDVSEARRSLRDIGKDSIAPLIDNLPKSTGYPHIATIELLGYFGPDAKDAIPALEADLDNRKYKSAATHALKQIRGGN